MSESKQPKVLLHKQKKGQRSPSGVYAANSSSPAGGAEVGRGVSTASKTPLPEPPPAPNQPVWYRFRTALTTLLVLNAVLVGYALLRTSIKPSEPLNEVNSLEKEEREIEEKPKESESKKADNLSDKESLESTESKASKSSKTGIQESPKVTTPHQPEPSAQVQNRPKPSNEEQQELYKWMLAEKRKTKPTTKAEKAQIDAEKALLKDFLRRKGVLDF